MLTCSLKVSRMAFWYNRYADILRLGAPGSRGGRRELMVWLVLNTSGNWPKLHCEFIGEMMMGTIRVRVAFDMIRKNKNKHIWDNYIWPRCTRQHPQPFAGINHQYQEQEGRRRGEGGQYQDHVNIMTLVSPRNPGNGKRYPAAAAVSTALSSRRRRRRISNRIHHRRGEIQGILLSSLGWRSRQTHLAFWLSEWN